jgi:hypothetical protein
MVTGLGLSLIGFAVQRLAKRLPATA